MLNHTFISKNESHLVMVYNPFNAQLILVHWYFVEELCIDIDKSYWSVVFFSFGIKVM